MTVCVNLTLLKVLLIVLEEKNHEKVEVEGQRTTTCVFE